MGALRLEYLGDCCGTYSPPPLHWESLALGDCNNRSLAIEHISIMFTYLATGVPGTPGLLSKGGLIGGGLPLTRPDLHFLYNLIETVPLTIAFVY